MRRFVQDYIRVLYAHNDGPQAVREFVQKYVPHAAKYCPSCIIISFPTFFLVPTAKDPPVPTPAFCPIW